MTALEKMLWKSRLQNLRAEKYKNESDIEDPVIFVIPESVTSDLDKESSGGGNENKDGQTGEHSDNDDGNERNKSSHQDQNNGENGESKIQHGENIRNQTGKDKKDIEAVKG